MYRYKATKCRTPKDRTNSGIQEKWAEKWEKLESVMSEHHHYGLVYTPNWNGSKSTVETKMKPLKYYFYAVNTIFQNCYETIFV